MEISQLIAETQKFHNERTRSLRQESMLRLKHGTPQKSGPRGSLQRPIDYFFNHLRDHITLNHEILRKRANNQDFAPNDLRKRTIQQLYFQQFRKLSVGA
ncbi:hypothetical protein HY772_02875 [Candidatus Woesearchaeota archaeon]|nr:hypothetical protein [Candidatus Woesearchaeota archaeon]